MKVRLVSSLLLAIFTRHAVVGVPTLAWRTLNGGPFSSAQSSSVNPSSSQNSGTQANQGCGPPPEVAYATLYAKTTTVGSIVIYKCQDGSSRTTSQCRQGNTWSTPNINCPAPQTDPMTQMAAEPSFHQGLLTSGDPAMMNPQGFFDMFGGQSPFGNPFAGMPPFPPTSDQQSPAIQPTSPTPTSTGQGSQESPGTQGSQGSQGTQGTQESQGTQGTQTGQAAAVQPDPLNNNAPTNPASTSSLSTISANPFTQNADLAGLGTYMGDMSPLNNPPMLPPSSSSQSQQNANSQNVPNQTPPSNTNQQADHLAGLPGVPQTGFDFMPPNIGLPPTGFDFMQTNPGLPQAGLGTDLGNPSFGLMQPKSRMSQYDLNRGIELFGGTPSPSLEPQQTPVAQTANSPMPNTAPSQQELQQQYDNMMMQQHQQMMHQHQMFLQQQQMMQQQAQQPNPFATLTSTGNQQQPTPAQGPATLQQLEQKLRDFENSALLQLTSNPPPSAAQKTAIMNDYMKLQNDFQMAKEAQNSGQNTNSQGQTQNAQDIRNQMKAIEDYMFKNANTLNQADINNVKTKYDQLAMQLVQAEQQTGSGSSTPLPSMPDLNMNNMNNMPNMNMNNMHNMNMNNMPSMNMNNMNNMPNMNMNNMPNMNMNNMPNMNSMQDVINGHGTAITSPAHDAPAGNPAMMGLPSTASPPAGPPTEQSIRERIKALEMKLMQNPPEAQIAAIVNEFTQLNQQLEMIKNNPAMLPSHSPMPTQAPQNSGTTTNVDPLAALLTGGGAPANDPLAAAIAAAAQGLQGMMNPNFQGAQTIPGLPNMPNIPGLNMPGGAAMSPAALADQIESMVERREDMLRRRQQAAALATVMGKLNNNGGSSTGASGNMPNANGFPAITGASNGQSMPDLTSFGLPGMNQRNGFGNLEQQFTQFFQSLSQPTGGVGSTFGAR